MKSISTLFLALLITIPGVISSYAKVADGSELFTRINSKKYEGDKTQGLEDRLTTVTEFKLSTAKADAIFNSKERSISISNFPINPFESSDIELNKCESAITGKTKWYKFERGAKVLVQGPKVSSYRGIIKGFNNSTVFLTYVDGYLFGSIKKTDGEYFDISTKEKGRVAVSPQNLQYLMGEYDPADQLKSEIDIQKALNKPKDKTLEDETPDFSKLLECRIAIDAVYGFYELMNRNYDKAAAYIAGVMSHVSILYEDAINVRITIPEVYIRADRDGDPYIQSGANDYYAMLFKMPEVWSNARTEGIALVCMFAGKNSGGSSGFSVGGISFGGSPGYGSLCDVNSGYCLFGISGGARFPNYNYTWDVSVSAHEIGHNFGAPHTHSCYYAPNMIDTCVTKTKPTEVWDACLEGENYPTLGTIMSYCHIANGSNSVELKFHPRQIPEMRLAAQRALCVKEPDDPYLQIIAPLAERRFASGSEIVIKWVSSKVEKVDIYYSSNGGETWNALEKNVPASYGKWTWKAPYINTTDALFEVVDSYNEELFDITNVPTTIIIPSVSIISPASGDSYSSKEKINISWNGSIAKRYNVYFSVNSGYKWKLIDSGTTYNVSGYDLSSSVSKFCSVKVEDADNPSIYAISPVFKVGAESFQIEYPKPGDTLCGSSEYRIQWKSENLHNFKMQWSSGDGATWKFLKMGTSLNANDSGLIWKTPTGILNNVKLRAVIQGEELYDIGSMLGGFTIDTCKLVSYYERNDNGGAFSIISIAPNPAGEEAEIKLICASEIGDVYVSIVSSIGAQALPERRYLTTEGINSISLNLSELPSGRYFTIIRSNAGIVTYPISVIR